MKVTLQNHFKKHNIASDIDWKKFVVKKGNRKKIDEVYLRSNKRGSVIEHLFFSVLSPEQYDKYIIKKSQIIFLKYLIEDNDLNLTEIDLQEIGFEIGADIPVCFYNRPALINGIGEHITEAKINKKFYLVLVNPMFSISTKYIYKKTILN